MAYSLQFVVVERGAPTPQLDYPSVTLHVDLWDDYHFKTMYLAQLHASPTQQYKLGNVKILKFGQQDGRTPIPRKFLALDQSFCSLGQDIDYYTTLVQDVPADLRSQYLSALRDVAADPDIREQFADEPGFKTSVLRFGQAVNAMESGGELLSGQAGDRGRMSFAFNWHRSAMPPIPFRFDDTQQLPGRCHVLIGYNGVGKTTLLADLAMAASAGYDDNVQVPSTILGTDTTFGAVIAVSYSPFDTFATPESVTGDYRPVRVNMQHYEDSDLDSQTEAFGYAYCGLRREVGGSSHGIPIYKLKSPEEIEAEFGEALAEVGSGEDRERALLIDAFKALAAEPSFGRAGVDLGQFGADLADQDATTAAFSRLSTGHKIVLNIVTQLAAHLKPRSLVLIDEPETHLHPPLMAALLRAIQGLLRGYDSFAVIATHSPVVVQEMQVRYVRVVERFVDQVAVVPATIETFGADIGSITRHIFRLDSSATDYQGVLEELARHFDLERIEAMFDDGLSPQARALVLNYQADQ